MTIVQAGPPKTFLPILTRSFPSFLRTFLLSEMSSRSNMASFRPVPSSLPETLRAMLALRNPDLPCPATVATTLASIPYFNSRTVAKTTAQSGSSHGGSSSSGGGRFGHIVNPRGDDGFRRNGWQSSSPSVDEEGFQSVRRRGGDRGDRGDRREYHGASGGGGTSNGGFRGPSHHAKTADTENRISHVTAEPVTEDGVVKFSSAAIKATIDVEDRILSKVKGKINKIGHSTYDATKVFMQQILDSDETDFLDEVMKFIFQKAATESTFCPLYAKLLHELADEFSHLRKAMVKLFHDYIDIFTEVESTPDVGSDNYRVFVEAQERKKFRRGYSQFVAELVKLGEADTDAFAKIIQQIVTVLETKHIDATNTLLCEEYIDCLANLCGCASGILSGADWSASVKDRLAVLAAKPRKDVPGLTNKARFALMDLIDSANRGWK